MPDSREWLDISQAMEMPYSREWLDISQAMEMPYPREWLDISQAMETPGQQEWPRQTAEQGLPERRINYCGKNRVFDFCAIDHWAIYICMYRKTIVGLSLAILGAPLFHNNFKITPHFHSFFKKNHPTPNSPER